MPLQTPAYQSISGREPIHGRMMFEKALIYRVGVDKLVDIGLLAETLFFYTSTQLLLDRSSVMALVQKIPHDVLVELFERDAVKLSYIREGFGVMSQGNLVEHDFGAFKFHGTAAGKKIKNHQEEIFETLERELGSSKQTRKLAKNIADRVALQRYRGVTEKEKIIPDLVRQDVSDSQFVRRAVGICLSHLVPGFDLSTPFRFDIFRSGSGAFVVDTDLDFEALNAIYHRFIPPEHSSLSVAYLLASLSTHGRTLSLPHTIWQNWLPSH